MFAHALRQVTLASGTVPTQDQVRCQILILQALTAASGNNMIDAVKQKRQPLVRFQQRHSAARPRRAQWLRMKRRDRQLPDQVGDEPGGGGAQPGGDRGVPPGDGCVHAGGAGEKTEQPAEAQKD